MKKKLIIIDAFSLIYKCFYGVRPMQSPKGVSTNAIYGFLNIILKIIQEQNPDYLFTAFDKGQTNFRHESYKEYKAGRQSMPEDLAEQLPYIENFLEKANVKIIKIDNYEADDIIGSVCRMADKLDIEAYALTGDRDSFQLVSDNTKILYSKRGFSDIEVIDKDYLMDHYSLTPSQMIDLKSLMGDKSDNIPGVMGVGEKTALNLLSKYETVEGVYENIENIKGKLKEKLEKDKDNAFLSKYLGTIKVDMDIDIDFKEEKEKTYDLGSPESIAMLRELDLKTIIKKIGAENVSVEQTVEESSKISYGNVEETYEEYSGGIDVLVSSLKKKEKISAYFELNDSLSKLEDLMIFDGEKFYLINDEKRIIEAGKKLFTECSKNLVTYNFKDIFKVLYKEEKADYDMLFDVYVGGYVLSPSDERYSLEVMSQKYLDIILDAGEEKGAKQLAFGFSEDKESSYKLYVKKAKNILALHEIFMENLKELEMLELYEDIEHKLITVLGKMELRGFKVDKEELSRLGADFEERIESLTADIRKIADEGDKFNINSPKQLGHVLFEKLGLPVIKKTKTGYSTNAEVLEKLKDHHVIIPMIMELRTLSKLNSTYVNGLFPLIDEENRIHSSLNQTITVTGRISSSNPNLQNIPVRTPEGRLLRKIFIPSDSDHVLVDADYSQIELRVLAHISKDEKLIQSFINNEDIHARTASEVFDVALDEVSGEMRRRAKAVNFGIVYGISDFGLSKDLGISRKMAKKYIDTYLAKYPGVSQYMTEIVEYAREHGFVKTMFNRRRYINEIHSRNFNLRSFGERTALNTPIQGSAADIIKIAMINVENRLKDEGLKARLILQVHDELIIDTPKDEVEKVKEILQGEMENVVTMSCPLKADVGVGNSWYEVK